MLTDKLIKCPFCEENDFDKWGLKHHIARGYCEVYEELAAIQDGVTVVAVAPETEMQKLQRRFEKMKANGLSDLKISPGDLFGSSAEDVAREMNQIFDAIEEGKFKPFSFNDNPRHPEDQCQECGTENPVSGSRNDWNRS